MIDVEHPLVCPQTWYILVRHLLLSKELGIKWWKALWKRDDSCCVLIRCGVLLGDSGAALGQTLVLEPLTLLDKHVPPERTIPCLERLVKLGHLTRSEGSMIQESILFKTTAGGQWRLSHREGIPA